MLPLQMAEVPTFEVGDYIYIPGIKAALDNPGTTFKGYVIHEDAPVTEITLYMESLTAEEREIIKAGSLINFNKNRQNVKAPCECRSHSALIVDAMLAHLIRPTNRIESVGQIRHFRSIRHLLSDAMLAHLIRPTNRIEP
ncbi:hypothetical protein [Escherichia coli]|uniref:hypothetical protein n=1 Tax=Escherichia coli TaxID=562 RepID=UPI00397ECCEB